MENATHTFCGLALARLGDHRGYLMMMISTYYFEELGAFISTIMLLLLELVGVKAVTAADCESFGLDIGLDGSAVQGHLRAATPKPIVYHRDHASTTTTSSTLN